jgi:hypothetical protein
MAYGIPGSAVEAAAGRGFPQVPMKLPMSVVRVGQQSLWSTQSYNAASVLANTQDRIFVTPRGQAGQGFGGVGMTIAETNLKESGRVPGGYAYDVFGIACYPYIVDVQNSVPQPTQPPTYADIANTLANCVLAWDFLQTQIEIANVHLIGGGGGVFGAGRLGLNAGAAAAADQAALTNSNGSIWLYNQHPVMLPSNATFGILLNWGQFAHTPIAAGNATSSFLVKVNLLGRFQTAIAVG